MRGIIRDTVDVSGAEKQDGMKKDAYRNRMFL